MNYGTAVAVQPPYDDAELALGIPDYITSGEGDVYLSLGNTPAGGTQSELVLEFVDNRLVDIEGPDLYVFEIGPQVEATELAISVDGVAWYDLGAIQGSTRAIDLAEFAVVPGGELFRFVRLRDRIDATQSNSPFGGPDIDAVGAIGADVSDGDDDGIHDDGDNCPALANTNQLDDESDQIGNPCDRCPQTLGIVEYDGCPEATPDAGAGGADAQAPATPDAGDDRPAPPEEEDEESPPVSSDDPAVGKNGCSCRMPGAHAGADSALGGSFGALVALALIVLRKARRA